MVVPKGRTKTFWAVLAGGLILGIALLCIAGIGFLQYWQATTAGDSIPSSETVEAVSEHPSEKKPELNQSYRVPADHPRLLIIPKLRTTSYIQPVGVDQTGVMATPNNIYFTGWYVKNVAPGEAGVSILNGHVGGRYAPGVFKDLKSLIKGDSITIEMGDQSKRSFRVVSVDSYEVSRAAEPLFKDDPEISNELHLITCDGAYNEVAKTYDQRVIVVAQRVDEAN